MASVVLRTAKKLRTYLDELKKKTKEAETQLSTYLVFDREQYESATWAFKRSSSHLNKCLSHIRQIQIEIEPLLAKECGEPDEELQSALHSVDEVEVHAEMVLAELEAKLLYLDEASNRQLGNTLEHRKKKSTGIESSSSEDGAGGTSPTHQAVKLPAADESSEKNKSNASQISVSASAIAAEDEVTNDKSVVEPSISEFNLKRFCGPDEDFKQFWLKFHETVGESPLETRYKFAALRSMIRGHGYKVFSDLDYRSDADYKVALSRLSDKFASQLEGVELKGELRPMPSFTEEVAFDICANRWSDDYFLNKYGRAAANYEKPNRELIVRAIHAFLNLYVVGPKRAPDLDYFNVWLILLHGVKFHDQYLVDSPTAKIFGADNTQVTFPNLEAIAKEHLFKFAPSFLKKKDNDANKPKFWKWTYAYIDGRTKIQVHITSKLVKEWYKTCWEEVERCDDEAFQNWVRYFALLSMILFRVPIKNPEAIENYVCGTFNRDHRGFCRTPSIPNAVPPHSGVHKFVRKTLFKKNSTKYKQYLTYLVGCYAFSGTNVRPIVRHFLNAGCLLAIAATGLGPVYWLRKAAESQMMKPKELLKFFLIDPSKEDEVKAIHRFLETYTREVTWWWARLFEHKRFRRVSTAYCPAFAYAAYIIQAPTETDIYASEDIPQFARYIKNGNLSAGVSGKNLGVALRNLIIEWNTTPLCALTQAMYKKVEKKKCAQV